MRLRTIVQHSLREKGEADDETPSQSDSHQKEFSGEHQRARTKPFCSAYINQFTPSSHENKYTPSNEFLAAMRQIDESPARSQPSFSREVHFMFKKKTKLKSYNCTVECPRDKEKKKNNNNKTKVHVYPVTKTKNTPSLLPPPT